MAVKNLESLVLRGVAVLEGGLVVNLRLGTSAKAGLQTPVPVTLGCRAIAQPFGWCNPLDYLHGEGAMPGAGRSRSRAGVPSSASSAHPVQDATCSTLPTASRSTDGGSRSAAVTSRAGFPALDATSVAVSPASWPTQRCKLLAVKGTSVGKRGTREG
jgi:hypothetical protein